MTAGPTRWGHGRLIGGPWLAAAIMIPVVLAVVVAITGHDSIENTLTARTQAALEARGITGAEVSFDGVQGTVRLAAGSLPEGMSTRGVEALLDDVDGSHVIVVIGSAAVDDTAAPAPTAPAPTSSAPPAAPDACANLQGRVDGLLGADRVAFGNDGATLVPPERAQVVSVALLLSGCGASAEVIGHTANRAPSASTVSQARADAVAAVLTEGGVTVLAVTGGRSDEPIGDNSTQAGRKLNRYAEIVVR